MFRFPTWTRLCDFSGVGDWLWRAEAADLTISVCNKLFGIQNLYRSFRSSTVSHFRFDFLKYFSDHHQIRQLTDSTDFPDSTDFHKFHGFSQVFRSCTLYFQRCVLKFGMLFTIRVHRVFSIHSAFVCPTNILSIFHNFYGSTDFTDFSTDFPRIFYGFPRIFLRFPRISTDFHGFYGFPRIF